MKKVIEQELEKIKLSKESEEYLENIADKSIKVLEKRLNKKKINATPFIGGSLAKGTLIRKKKQDIDIFLRFDKNYSEEEIKRLFRKLFFWFWIPGERVKVKKLHGSRDYYKIIFKKSGISVEVVPTLKISKPEQARNLTDLSYFHVNYIKKKISEDKRIADEIKLAKSFAHGQNCYGAESYIKGFSGYALEILVAYYKNFNRFLKEIAKAESRIVLDPAKHFKTKEQILKELNPTKTKSPIILIDPTFKERNAARALSLETFKRFKKSAIEFLENPNVEFFEPKKIRIIELREVAKEHKGIFAVFEISTKKQPGDIAGSKLLKFSKFLNKEAKRYFDVEKWEFDYPGLKRARVYSVLKRKKEIVFVGPEVHRELAVKNFKKKHPIWYIEDGKIKSARPTDISVKKFLRKFKKAHKKTMKQMAIKKIKIV
jgi:tRNA nucleotidyltransferase (CCA-adding enzyme)